MPVSLQSLKGDIRDCCFLPPEYKCMQRRKEPGKCPRRESTVRLLNLKNSGGRALISLFAKKIMRPWDRVRAGAARRAKKDRCGDEKTAGGAVCTRLKAR